MVLGEPWVFGQSNQNYGVTISKNKERRFEQMGHQEFWDILTLIHQFGI